MTTIETKAKQIVEYLTKEGYENISNYSYKEFDISWREYGFRGDTYHIKGNIENPNVFADYDKEAILTIIKK